MSRLEVIEKLSILENRKDKIVRLKNDIENCYFESGYFKVDIETNSYTKNYKGEHITFKQGLFHEYLTKEEKYVENQIRELIDKLSNL